MAQPSTRTRPYAPTAERLVDDLAARLAERLGCREVTDLERLSGGASRETYRFRADAQPLILQRRRDGDARDVMIEAEVLRRVRAAGVPVAEVVDVSSDPHLLGAPFLVLTALEGETIARRILRDDAFADARVSLVRQIGGVLATMHDVDVSDVGGLGEIDQLVSYRQLLATLGEPHPAFELGLRWLESNRPPARESGLVHGDFRLGNLLIGSHGLVAVLDWELTHRGEPLEDIGWLCVKAWRFGGPGRVAGLGGIDELIEGYREVSGRRPDADEIHWWEVLGTVKWGIMCIVQAAAHLGGAVRSHELAAIGRRVCENEHDMFLALEGRW